MRGERSRSVAMMAAIIGFFTYVMIAHGPTLTFDQLTGYAVFEEYGSNFSNGTHENTTNNATHLYVTGDNTLTGIYTSEILDAGNDAYWNNLTWIGGQPSIAFVYLVDASGSVYESADVSSWTETNTNYGRTSDTQYLFADSSYVYIIAQSNREVWRSPNGTDFIVINDTFADSGIHMAATNSSESLFVADASGDVYTSNDQGKNWIKKGDFNAGATNNPLGFAANSTDGLFILDAAENLYTSADHGATWNSVTHDYPDGNIDDMIIDSTDNFYILRNQDVWWSNNSGANWTKVNDSFTPHSQDGLRITVNENDILYIGDERGRVFSSSDQGVSWTEESDTDTGSNSDTKGITEFLKPTMLSFEYQNCSLANCSDGSWSSGNLNNLSLMSQYFQYRISFTSPNAGNSSNIQNITIDYDLVNEAPQITLHEPQSILYLSNESLALNYSVSDQDANLDTCWYNLDNGANTTLTNCTNSTFNTSEGQHNIYLYANDTLGLVTLANISFNVDATGVFVDITSPTGTLDSRSDISLEYTTVGNNLSCVYNVQTSIGGSVIDNTTLANCTSTTFDVSTDGDYVVHMYLNNTLGSTDYDNQSFSVDTTPPPSGGGSGGGGGSSGGGGGGSTAGSTSSSTKLSIEPLNVIISYGEEKTLNAEIKNTGLYAANKCKLVARQPYDVLMETQDIENIAAGELIELSFILKASSSNITKINMSVECLDEVKEELNLSIKLIIPSIDISIDKMEFSSDGLLVNYSIESVKPNTEHLTFKLLNRENDLITEREEQIKLEKGITKGTVTLDLSEAKAGMLKVSVSEKNKEDILIEETVIYDGSSAITGLAIGQLNLVSPLSLTIMFFSLLVIIVGFRIIHVHKKTRASSSGTVREMMPSDNNIYGKINE